MTIHVGDCRQVLRTLEPLGASAIVTSPPYLQQRRYGDSDDELGLERTLAAYVTNVVDAMEAARPHLRDDGLAWLNLGDKANASGGAGGDWSKIRHGTRRGRGMGPGTFRDPDYEEATFLDVPGAVLRALLERGWRLRLPIVWDKGRESPESLRHVNRPRWAHEMIYLLSPTDRKTAPRPRFFPSMLAETGSVWHFPPGGSGPSHLAPFPDELARRCILASTLPGDLVLDPFAGSGTTIRIAEAHGRHGIGIELYAGENQPDDDTRHQGRRAWRGPRQETA